METVFVTHSEDVTQELARELSKHLIPNTCMGLIGELGVGKTCFVRGLAEGLGVDVASDFHSPTYTLMNAYAGRSMPLYHLDVYRITDDRDLDETGVDEKPLGAGVTVIEWIDQLKRHQWPVDIFVQLKHSTENENDRVIAIRAHAPPYEKIIHDLKATWDLQHKDQRQ